MLAHGLSVALLVLWCERWSIGRAAYVGDLGAALQKVAGTSFGHGGTLRGGFDSGYLSTDTQTLQSFRVKELSESNEEMMSELGGSSSSYLRCAAMEERSVNLDAVARAEVETLRPSLAIPQVLTR